MLLLWLLYYDLRNTALSYSRAVLNTLVVKRACRLLYSMAGRRIACIPVSAASMHMILDASTGWLCAFEYVRRHALRHDYIGDLPINDVAWFAC